MDKWKQWRLWCEWPVQVPAQIFTPAGYSTRGEAFHKMETDKIHLCGPAFLSLISSS